MCGLSYSAMNIPTKWSCFVLLSVTYLTWAEKFDVIGPDKTIIAFAGEDVILPASLSPTLNAEDFEVRWFRDDLSSPVLLYQNHQIRPEEQIQSYQVRAALFHDKLPNGNLSLKLQDVHISDGGLYHCFVDSGVWNNEAQITLSVEALGAQPLISMSSKEEDSMRLECRSGKWGTMPDMTWRDKDGEDVTSESNITVERDKEGFLVVSSVITIKREFNVFSCLVRNKVKKPGWQAGLTIYSFSPGISCWSVIFWLSLILTLAAMVLLILKWRRMKVQCANYDHKVNFLRLHYLHREIEKIEDPAFIQTIPKVIKRYSHEDLLNITEYYKPCLAFLIKHMMTSILQTLVTKQILTSDEAKIVKAKQECGGTEAVESFIREVMEKDRVTLVSLWEALTQELEKFPSPNLIRIMKDVTEEGKKLLEEIQTSIQSPLFEPHIKDLFEAHRLTVHELTRSLNNQSSPADSHTRAVGFETQYTELTVVKCNTRIYKDTEHELVKTGRIHELLMEKGATEKYERIWTEQLFRTSLESVNPTSIVVVSGVAGIGKTTMIQKIMFDWARGTQYQRFAFVFLFKFRELNLLGKKKDIQMSLSRLIERHYKYLSDSRLREILQKPQSLLFILDGLDEYKLKLDFTQSPLCLNPDDEVPVHILVTSLVSQTLLKGCTVLITTRPTALETLDMERVDRFAVILGFFPEQRLMYFKKFFGDADQGTEAFQHVEENAILYTMCFNPSYCWIMCSVLKSHFMTPKEEKRATLTTVTELFVVFIHNILINYSTEVKDIREILIKLGKIAYYGVDNRILVFYEKQKMSSFDLHTVLTSPLLSEFLQRQNTPEYITYAFQHLTLQEFMAACSFYLSPPDDIEKLLMKLDSCKDGKFEILTQFLAGLSRPSVFKILAGNLGEFEMKTTQKIMEWMKLKAERVLQGTDKNESLQVCQWLCETQNKDLIRDAIGKELTINFTNTTLSVLNCAVLGSVISCCGELQRLELSKSHLTPECMRRLATAISYCNKVMLSQCGLTPRCCAALSSALSAPHSRLTYLDLDNNDLGDSGVAQLCEGLMHENCKLDSLRLVKCGLTSGCCSALSSALSSPYSRLTYLDMDSNNIGDSGVDLLYNGLRSENCKLEVLWLQYNQISEPEKRDLRSLKEELNRSGRRVNINT